MHTVNQGNREFEIIPADQYPARCVSFIDLGTQVFEYLGEQKSSRKFRLSWEFPTELRIFKEENGEQPFLLSKEYSASIGDKSNLRKDLESWRGRPFTPEELENFDLKNVIGIECLIQVIHKPRKDGSKTYANINAISKLPKGMICPPQINETVFFDLDNHTQDELDSLPVFIRDKIMNSIEMKALNKQESLPEFE